MIVRFYGGPLGGEERELPDDTGYRYRVPALRRRPIPGFRSEYDTIVPAPGLDPYDIQEYEYDGEVFSHIREERVRRFRWIDPYDGLRQQIDKLKATVRRQEEVIAELEAEKFAAIIAERKEAGQ